MRRALVHALAAVGLVVTATAAPAHAAGPAVGDPLRAGDHAPTTAARATAQARARGLGLSEPWLRLGVWRPGARGGWESQIDGDGSFLAPSGRHDPPSELDATIAALLAPIVPGREDEHALCRFPARARWIAAVLGLALPDPRCERLERFVVDFGGDALDVVYAANYLDNPTSAFGHIFVRIRRRDDSVGGAMADLDDAGVDFTAATDTRNPVLYAAKGLSGLFRGRFRASRYDTMLREYATADARNVWEYQLALTADEVRLFTLHLWELHNAEIDYLYVTENCAYRMVAAIDAAAPRLHLEDRLGTAVLPIDVVHAIMDEPDLVKRVVYRPSVASTLRAALDPLSSGERGIVDALLSDAETPLPPQLSRTRRAMILDAAVRVVDARHARAMIYEGDPIVAVRRRLAERRDEVAPRSGEAAEAAGGFVAPPPRPYHKAPHRAHGPVRLMVGSGMTSQYGTAFGTLGARLALHDLADPPDGTPELLELELLDARLRLDLGRGVVTVDTLTFAELLSIDPLTEYEHRPSWKLRFFGTRLHDDGCFDCFSHGLEAGIGAAAATEEERAAIFLMAQAHVGFASGLDGIDGSAVRAGVGPWAGVRLRLPAETIALVHGSWSFLPEQEGLQTFDVRASVRTGLARDVAIGLEAAVQPRSAEAQLASFVYF